jgi:hypothetical protein
LQLFSSSCVKKADAVDDNMRLPKIPKGLAARIRKAEAKLEQKKKVEARKKEIAAMRKKLEMLNKRA